MCGIFCSISSNCHVFPSNTIAERLQSRGPDSQGQIIVYCSRDCDHANASYSSDIFVTLYSTVLSLRGNTTVQQPYQDETRNYTLCWNGEAWNVAGESVKENDTKTVLGLLIRAAQKLSTDVLSRDAKSCAERIAQALSTVAGPYAFVFFDHARNTLFYGRDFLGRRSLITKVTSQGDLLISSVSDGKAEAGWTETEADGVYYINLHPATTTAQQGSASSTSQSFRGIPVPYHFSSPANASNVMTQSVIPNLSLSRNIPDTPIPLNEHSTSVSRLKELLRESLALRVIDIPSPPSEPDLSDGQNKTRMAILFSGGLDCTILARISHDLLSISEPIDLLNVAFENPRIHKIKTGETDPDRDIYELCPDRITGRSTYAELQQACPHRTWRFVPINIPYAEFSDHRDQIISLMHPHNTEMDISIASALYFAARGQGQVRESSHASQRSYTSPARVLLSGLGADEIFAGYTRHATAFNRAGFPALLDELQLDVSRLGKRNLGRDDRVMSHWGKEVRFPYLDEQLLSWALDLPVTEKCGFGETDSMTSEDDRSLSLEPGKKFLRCLAWKLGMKGVAAEKKRAIQFGARTAKMQTGKTKGTHLITPSSS